MKNKVLSVIAAAALTMTSFAALAVTASAEGEVDLSELTGDYTAQDGETLTGTLSGIYKITIAAGATVTLKDVTINGVNDTAYKWAGITPLGDATIVLEGENTVKGFHKFYPGIYAAENSTLTIRGTGSLTASSNGDGTGIGGGYNPASGAYTINCGNIVIEGGNITAIGGNEAAGIGSGRGASCGTITITDGVTCVTAIRGGSARNSIGGGGNGGSVRTITIGGVVTGTIQESPYTYPKTVDLSKLNGNFTARNGQTLTGTLGSNSKITIADGATVTLKDAVIDRESDIMSSWCNWAGITPLGDATIVLEGANTVKGFYDAYPGIYAAENSTLTIQGTGSLTAACSGNGGAAAGIGGGQISCGNIVIAGGNITAKGGRDAAGIGGGSNADCGDITISGGTVTATGGEYGAGIGAGRYGNCGNITISGGTVTAAGSGYGAGIGSGEGYDANKMSECGDITITDGVTRVTASSYVYADSIGTGRLGSVGTITIGGEVKGRITDRSYTYPDQTTAVTGAVTEIMANHGGKDEGAMAFITTLTKSGSGEVTVGSVTWSITADDKTRSCTVSKSDGLPALTFGGDGSTVIIVLAVNNLYDPMATATVSVD